MGKVRSKRKGDTSTDDQPDNGDSAAEQDTRSERPLGKRKHSKRKHSKEKVRDRKRRKAAVSSTSDEGSRHRRRRKGGSPKKPVNTGQMLLASQAMVLGRWAMMQQMQQMQQQSAYMGVMKRMQDQERLKMQPMSESGAEGSDDEAQNGGDAEHNQEGDSSFQLKDRAPDQILSAQRAIAEQNESVDATLKQGSASGVVVELTELDRILDGGGLQEKSESSTQHPRRRFGWDSTLPTDSEKRPMFVPPPAPTVVHAPSAGSSAGAPLLQAPPAKLGGDAWELARASVGLKLVGEMAPSSCRWEYRLFDESRRCFVGFLPRTLSKDVCASFFEKAYLGSWFQPTSLQGPIPRRTSWMVGPNCTCAYRYGHVEIQPQQFPQWMVTLLQWVMPCCGVNQSSDWPNSCNLNLYAGGDMSVGWHADDEQLFLGKFHDCRIISLSLGATRSFELRHNWPDADARPLTLQLGDGDLCTMEGMCQKHFQHRVPSEATVTGARINLTWRWITQHSPLCPAPRAAPT